LAVQQAQPDTKMLFATIKGLPVDTADIRAAVQDLRVRWRQMIAQQHPHPDVRKPLGDLIAGGFKWLEVARDDQDHNMEKVHEHQLLVMHPNYCGRNRLSKDTWRDLWLQTADGHGSAFAEPVRSIEAVAGYVSDAAKFTKLAQLAAQEPHRFIGRAEQLKGLHIYQSWGQSHGRLRVAQLGLGQQRPRGLTFSRATPLSRHRGGQDPPLPSP
jgi:hypothetical protein